MTVVGRISPRRTGIPEIFTVWGQQGGGGTGTVILGAPIGVQVGDTMVATVSAGGWAGGGGPYYFYADPAWTPVHEDPDAGVATGILTNLYYKTADADDAANTASYTWAFSTDGGLPGISVVHCAWRRRYGTVLSNGTASHSSTPSISSPGGRWQFIFISQRTANAFAEPEPTPIVTSPATELFFLESFSGRAGAIRIYAGQGASPITGVYTPGFVFPAYGLVAAAVT